MTSLEQQGSRIRRAPSGCLRLAVWSSHLGYQTHSPIVQFGVIETTEGLVVWFGVMTLGFGALVWGERHWGPLD